MKEEFTKEEMEKAHSDNGSCGSCGWHAMFWEHDYERTDQLSPVEYHDTCKNSEGEDTSDHRGCYIYPVKETPNAQSKI